MSKITKWKIMEKIDTAIQVGFSIVTVGLGTYLMVEAVKQTKLTKETLKEQSKFFKNMNIICENVLYYDEDEEE